MLAPMNKMLNTKLWWTRKETIYLVVHTLFTLSLLLCDSFHKRENTWYYTLSNSPIIVLIVVAVTFNIIHKAFIIKGLWIIKEWQKWQEKRMDSIGGGWEGRVDSDDSNKGCECGLDKFVRFLYTYQKQKGDVESHYVGSGHILLLFNPYMIQPYTRQMRQYISLKGRR